MRQDVADILIERAINGTLYRDLETKRDLAALSGKIIALDFEGTGRQLSLCLDEEGARVIGTPTRAPHVTITGTPWAFIRVWAGGGEDKAPSGAQLSITGEVVDAQRLRNIISRRSWDLEEQLTRLMGDIGAHQFVYFVRTFLDATRHTGSIFLRDVGDYVCHEMRLLPAQPELDKFTSSVDIVRHDVERLEQRIQRLQATRPETGA